MSGIAATAFAIFFAIVVGLAIACRRLAQSAEADHAESVLRAEIDHLEE